jgi:hypothetical protein
MRKIGLTDVRRHSQDTQLVGHKAGIQTQALLAKLLLSTIMNK